MYVYMYIYIYFFIHEDFGRNFEGVSSSLAESMHAHDWSKRHQGRRGAYMATPADRLHTATGGCALEQPAAWSWCVRVVLVAHDAVLGIPRGRLRLQGTQHSTRAH